MKLSRWQIVLLVATALVAVAAAGCTGTDFLASGNSLVSFEVAVQGTTTGTYDCLNFEFGNVRIRPLTGVCGPGSANPGDPCFNFTDCPPGAGASTCENSEAAELLGNNGVLVANNTETVRGNLLGEACVPTTAGGGICSPGGAACVQTSDCVDPNPNDGILPTCLPKFFGQAADPFVPLAPITMSEGLYEINELNIANISLYTDDPLFLGRCGSNLTLALELGELRFAVEPGRDQLVRIVIDLAELEQALPGLESCATLTAAVDSVFACQYGPLGDAVSCLVP